MLSATAKIPSAKPSGVPENDLTSILWKLCYSTSIEVLQESFYTNQALMEIFLQNCVAVHRDEKVSAERDDETLDLLVQILHNVVHHLKIAEPKAELPQDLLEICKLI